MQSESTDRNVEFEDIDANEDSDIEEESGPLFWSMKIEKVGEDVPINPPSEDGYIVHITHASFGATVKNGSRSVVMVKDGQDQEVPICVLIAGKHENEQLDLLFDGPTLMTLRGQKPSTVYLTGYSQPDLAMDRAMGGADDMSPEEVRAMMAQNGMDNFDDEDVDAPQLIDDNEDVEDEEEQSKAVVTTTTQEPPQKKQKLEKGAKATKQTEKTENTKRKKVDKKGKKEEEKKESKKDEKKKKKEKTKNKKLQTMKGGIKYRDLKTGDGATVKAGQTLTVSYVGQLPDGKVFDKAIGGDGFQFVLGKGEVIKGWDMGLRGAKVGAKRKLVIPAKLAYGEDGQGDDIPPNTDLTFTIELRAAN